MEINVLGVYGGSLPNKCTTSFLIEKHLLVDAGSPTAFLSLSQQAAIDHILVSHTHVDHIRDIPFLADNLMSIRQKPIEIISPADVIQSLRTHLFNDQLWPDFSALPEPEGPVLVWRAEAAEKIIQVGRFQVEFVRTTHPVPTYAMFINDGTSTLLYVADTGPTQRVWQVASKYSNLKAVILEMSFPNQYHKLSKASGHLRPSDLPIEVAKLAQHDIPVYLFHFKPAFEEQLLQELKELANPRFIPLIQGQKIII